MEGDGLEKSLTGCHVTDLGLLHVAWGLVSSHLHYKGYGGAFAPVEVAIKVCHKSNESSALQIK